MLCSNMQYSCAIWKDDTKTLEEAQINKLNHIIKKLKIKKGDKILDIGCGFGTAAAYIAQQTGCEVTGITLSKNQLDYAVQNAKDLNLFVRVSVSNEHAEIDLSKKFGALTSEAIGLLRLAKLNSQKVGLSFHVGSKCMHPISYAKGISEIGIIALTLRKLN